MIVKHDRSGLWWPSEVVKVDAEYDYMLKRVTDVDLAVKRCRKRHIAVQAGGNVGMWPLRIAKSFEIVHTFEAVSYYVEALKANTEAAKNVIVHHGLLSSRVGAVVPFALKPDGRSRVVYTDEANSEQQTTTIDSLALPGCDALFLDVEGHEIEALMGAIVTISKYRPVITVEVWEKNASRYDEFFARVDYVPVVNVHADRIYVPR